MGAAAISRMTYHEWAGQGGAARLAVGPRPGACLRSAVGQGASGRERVLTSRRVGSLMIDERLTSLSILARLGASEGRSDACI